MSDDIKVACQRMIGLVEEFAENSDAVDELLSRDNAEELLVALALSEAFVKGAVILEPRAEVHIQASEKELKEILEEMGDSDEEDEE